MTDHVYGVSPCCDGRTHYDRIERSWVCESCGAKGPYIAEEYRSRVVAQDKSKSGDAPTPAGALHHLAHQIATRLFTSGGTDFETQGPYSRAQRLVLTIDKPTHRTLGGWSFENAVNEIERALLAAEARAEKEKP